VGVTETKEKTVRQRVESVVAKKGVVSLTRVRASQESRGGVVNGKKFGNRED